MLEIIKGYIKVFQYDALSENGESFKKGIIFVCLGITCTAVVTSVLNFINRSWIMGSTTMVFAIFGLISFIILKKGHEHLQKIVSILTVFLAVFFTYYYVTGANEGFAALWIIMAPMLMVILGGSIQSLTIGVYFLFVVILLSYTPLRSLVTYDYNIEFVHRFPVLYSLSLIVSMNLNYQIQKFRISQNRAVEVLEDAVLAERKRNQEMSLHMITAMSSALDAKDSYTNAHSERVGNYCRLIAKEIGLSEDDQNAIYFGGLVHDIGKIGVRDLTLNSHAALTEEQYYEIKRHPVVGKRIIAECIDDKRILDSIEYHHERFDGFGYPAGLKGEEIPLFARILCVADSFDAMNSTRAYRKACDKNYILSELEKGKNKQFDPEIVDVFLKLLSEIDFEVENVEI